MIKILERDFFPLSLQERCAQLSSSTGKHYQPTLIDSSDEPKAGFVKETIFKQQLLACIKQGLLHKSN